MKDALEGGPAARGAGRLALVAVLALSAGVPPGWLPAAPLWTLLGWAACYRLSATPRAKRWAYVVGALQVGILSWSTRHVLGWAPLGIGLLGGLYFVLIVVWTRALRLLPGPLAFGLAVAAAHWLRAHMPEIHYPHGQPAHSFYRQPALLGIVAWGGEVLANLSVAGAAAALSDVVASLRLGRRAAHAPATRRSLRGALVCAAAFLGVAALAAVVPAPRAVVPAAPAVSVLAVQPGFDPGFQHGGFLAAVQRSLVQPTLARAGPGTAAPPDLVLWPETSYPAQLVGGGSERPRLQPFGGWRPPLLAPGTRLLAGTVADFGDRRVPVGVLTDARGRYLDHHEKRWLVPAGEVIPFLRLLPQAARDWLNGQVARTVGVYFDLEPGRERAPLQTASGVPFAALLCFDNAFPTVAERAVDRGARFLAVLSNEAWYRRGAELGQMEAMTVFRALETATPVVRATIDGPTLVVGPDGQVASRLPFGPAADGGARVLAVAVQPGPGRLRPLAWLHRAVVWIVLLSGLAVLWHVARSWARLDRVRSRETGDPPSSVGGLSGSA